MLTILYQILLPIGSIHIPIESGFSSSTFPIAIGISSADSWTAFANMLEASSFPFKT